MKKLLGLFGSILLVTANSTVAVSCHGTHHDNYNIPKFAGRFNLKDYNAFDYDAIISWLKKTTGLKNVYFKNEKNKDTSSDYIIVNNLTSISGHFDDFSLDLTFSYEGTFQERYSRPFQLKYVFDSNETKQLNKAIYDFFGKKPEDLNNLKQDVCEVLRTTFYGFLQPTLAVQIKKYNPILFTLDGNFDFSFIYDLVDFNTGWNINLYNEGIIKDKFQPILKNQTKIFNSLDNDYFFENDDLKKDLSVLNFGSDLISYMNKLGEKEQWLNMNCDLNWSDVVHKFNVDPAKRKFAIHELATYILPYYSDYLSNYYNNHLLDLHEQSIGDLNLSAISNSNSTVMIKNVLELSNENKITESVIDDFKKLLDEKDAILIFTPESSQFSKSINIPISF